MSDPKFNLIFIIDDDMIFRESAKMWLMKEGIVSNIQTFEDGELAINWFKEHPSGDRPDLIILDINMPIMDGWDYLEEFDKLDMPDKNSVDTIMVSSSINPEDVERAHNNKWLKDYVNKPLTPDKMQELFST